jgi:hypothetical protein
MPGVAPSIANSILISHLVMEPNICLNAALQPSSCDLTFHDCGELTDAMVEALRKRLHSVILSLGSSRTLWEDARLVRLEAEREGWAFEEIDGSLALLQRLVDGERDEAEFLVVPPGAQVKGTLGESIVDAI